MRSVQFNNRHNETKLIILKLLAPHRRWYTSLDIAEATGLKPNNVSRQLTKLFHQGYVWRRNVGKKCHLYRFLKPMGDRVIKKLWIREYLKKETGDEQIDFNLEHELPDKIKILTTEAENHFYPWLFTVREPEYVQKNRTTTTTQR